MKGKCVNNYVFELMGVTSTKRKRTSSLMFTPSHNLGKDTFTLRDGDCDCR